MASAFGHTLFSKEQIAEAIEGLEDYEAYEDVATLNVGGDTRPDALAAFASMAKALGLPVSGKYGTTLYIRRRKPDSELRSVAVVRLQRRYEAGEIEAMAA